MNGEGDAGEFALVQVGEYAFCQGAFDEGVLILVPGVHSSS